MDQAKADARAQAQKLAAEAEREGRALLQQGREQAAKAAAAKRREEILAQADRDCEALKKEAGSRMGKAAQAILGRVVGN